MTIKKKAIIEKLTDEETKMIPVIRDKWIEIGLRTGLCQDRAFVEENINEAYRLAKLTPPQTIEWVDSPFAGTNRVKELIPGSTVPGAIYGQHDADWLSYYDFFSRLKIDLPVMKQLRPLMNIAQHVGWWWAFDTMAIVSERPVELHRDAAHRLHNENGMAIRYNDGWGVYSWHGYRIPSNHSDIIENRAGITPSRIEAEPNAELRRVMLEIYGYGNYLAERQAKVISEDKDGAGNDRRLLEITVAGEKLRVIELLNSSLEPDGTSRKTYHLGALAGTETPHEAVAASFGFNPEAFKEVACS